jgi:aminobenzoyl-glutamate utilization protein B
MRRAREVRLPTALAPSLVAAALAPDAWALVVISALVGITADVATNRLHQLDAIFAIFGASDRDNEIGNKIAEAAAQANIMRVGLPQWTDEEQAFAKAVQRQVDGKDIGLNTKVKEIEVPQARPPESGGSDDIGDVSWVVPTVTIRYPANIPNLPGHNWSNAIAMATPIAHKGIIAGSKVVAITLIDLLERPELVKEAKTYFTDVQLKNNKTLPLLADTDQPQIAINRDIMERFRPQMRAYYYDAERCDTYLEQLGVKFPTLARTPAP